MKGLTPNQSRMLAFISDYIAERGYSPLLEEIAVGLNLSPKSKGYVQSVIVALADRGALTYQPRLRRSIALVPQPRGGDDVDFLPDHLAVWVRVVAARAGCTPLEVVIEAVRDGYGQRPKQKQNVSREAFSATPAPAVAQ